ncbi:MAG: hypothetical protein AMJ53_11270, partial [Gammaproteobacteria bacterium SG8_11]
MTSAFFLALFLFSMLPAAAIASGDHHERSYDKHWSKKEWSKKDSFEKWSKKSWAKKENYKKEWSKKKWSGKKCDKKQKCDNSLSIPLYVKGGKRVGKVTVRLDGGDLKVSYKVNEGWYIKQTHLQVADSYDGLPLKVDGSPDVDAFQYSSKHFTPVKSADFTISASQWPLGTDLYVAAEAVVITKTFGKCKQHSAKSSHGKKHYSKKGKKDYGKKHYSDDDDDDHKHHDHDNYGKAKELQAWAVVEKFPGQALAGYFIYTLESCDSVEKSVIQFSDAIYTVKEEGPAAVITVVRTGNLDLAASVVFTTIDGSAVNGADYVFANGVLDFAPGETSAQFEITTIDDTEVEPVETLTLELSNPLGAELGQQKTATLEIEDNDEVTAAVIAIDRIVPNPVNEGDTVVVYVTRTGDLNVDATVDFGTLDGTAIGATQCGAPATPVPFDYEQVGGT